jgi:hypothetical protein
LDELTRQFESKQKLPRDFQLKKILYVINKNDFRFNKNASNSDALRQKPPVIARIPAGEHGDGLGGCEGSVVEKVPLQEVFVRTLVVVRIPGYRQRPAGAVHAKDLDRRQVAWVKFCVLNTR